MKDLKLWFLTRVLNLFLYVFWYLVLFYNKIQEYVKKEISSDMEANNSEYSKWKVYKILLDTKKFPIYDEGELERILAEYKEYADSQHRAFEESRAGNGQTFPNLSRDELKKKAEYLFSEVFIGENA
jgi:hypothetical protein